MKKNDNKNSSSQFDNLWLGLLPGLVIMVALVLIINRQKPATGPAFDEPRQASMVEVDYRLFSQSLAESCHLKGRNELRCDEGVVPTIMRDVDSTAVSVKGNTIAFKHNGNYISIPATLLANMIDQRLVNTASL